MKKVFRFFNCCCFYCFERQRFNIDRAVLVASNHCLQRGREPGTDARILSSAMFLASRWSLRTNKKREKERESVQRESKKSLFFFCLKRRSFFFLQCSSQRKHPPLAVSRERFSYFEKKAPAISRTTLASPWASRACGRCSSPLAGGSTSRRSLASALPSVRLFFLFFFFLHLRGEEMFTAPFLLADRCYRSWRCLALLVSTLKRETNRERKREQEKHELTREALKKKRR